MNARPCLRKAGMSLLPEGLESVVEVLVRHPGVSSGLEVVILLGGDPLASCLGGLCWWEVGKAVGAGGKPVQGLGGFCLLLKRPYPRLV